VIQLADSYLFNSIIKLGLYCGTSTSTTPASMRASFTLYYAQWFSLILKKYRKEFSVSMKTFYTSQKLVWNEKLDIDSHFPKSDRCRSSRILGASRYIILIKINKKPGGPQYGNYC
jgi:hypothetical protein